MDEMPVTPEEMAPDDEDAILREIIALAKKAMAKKLKPANEPMAPLPKDPAEEV